MRSRPAASACSRPASSSAVVSHQVGGFLGAWLGGKALEATGNYDWMWYADIVLALGAALVHLSFDRLRTVGRSRSG